MEKVLESTDIVDLISSYIEVKRAGSQFRANCPFHHEKTPSFYITPSSQRFHCFGCGKGGDAISFVREYENLPFTDAVRKLALKAGVVIIEEASDPKADASRKSRGRLMDIHREATAFFHELLMKNAAAGHARDYLKSRGFGREMADRWALGWMPDNPRMFLDWARARKFSGRELVDSGIVKLKEDNNPKSGLFVRFQDRLMFPIRNEIGDVIAFTARQLRENKNSGKYINSPETAIYKKSRVFFALDRAKKSILNEKAALLCEGQLDAICCHESGITQAIATSGTACTADHARILKRYTSNVLLCFDADRAGLEAVEKAYRQLAPEGLGVRVVEMPAGDDPDSYLKSQGADAFRQLLANAKEFFDFKLERGKATGRFDSAAERAVALGECVEMLALMSDFAARENQINIVATHLQTSSVVLRDEIAKAKANPKKNFAEKLAADEVSPPAVPTPLHRIVAFLCHLALSSGQAQRFLCEQFETLHEANRWVEGIPLLEAILGAAPDPASHAAVNGFLATLPEADRLSLAHETSSLEGVTLDGMQAAEQALALLSGTVLQRRDAAVKAQLKQPGLSMEKTLELLHEVKEISGLLRGIGQRSEFNDELPASTYKEKKPWGKWKGGPKES
ncbi:DNA primase [Luteolibacter yonseiensis]|uniref:DNA primase n=1 Tax=Luteolibacter yonseiensis TaxID=1144680 RepID=A0A934R2G4_9BACT|nr:DNA primase [Luteolibacter yonseiensis]